MDELKHTIKNARRAMLELLDLLCKNEITMLDFEDVMDGFKYLEGYMASFTRPS